MRDIHRAIKVWKKKKKKHFGRHTYHKRVLRNMMGTRFLRAAPRGQESRWNSHFRTAHHFLFSLLPPLPKTLPKGKLSPRGSRIHPSSQQPCSRFYQHHLTWQKSAPPPPFPVVRWQRNNHQRLYVHQKERIHHVRAIHAKVPSPPPPAARRQVLVGGIGIATSGLVAMLTNPPAGI